MKCLIQKANFGLETLVFKRDLSRPAEDLNQNGLKPELEGEKKYFSLLKD
ncbi:hypothetical protein ACFOG5_01990 [Pedobacter fastidiosus]